MKFYFVIVSFFFTYVTVAQTQLTLGTDQENHKTAAFKILTIRCNECHATKKRTDIFTMANMDSLAADIHHQVFVKKKMPKGRKNNLTTSETKALQAWLDVTIKK